MADENPLAAIDIGSNSFRLELGQIRRGRYKRLIYHKRTVRLGAGLDANSRLTDAAAERGLECLREFAQIIGAEQPTAVRAVATQTLREAANRDEFLARAQEVLGHPIEVISGREEARLIYAGVSFLQPSEERQLIIDIGGRSTEMILGVGSQPQAAESFAVGSVSLSMRHFPDGQLTAEAFRQAQAAAGAQFEEALRLFAPDQWQQALGSSGTVGAVSNLLRARGVSDGVITPAALAGLIEDCVRAGHVDRLQWEGLKEDRRAVLPGGLAILYTLAVHFGIAELQPAKGALRQGVIVDLHGRLGGGRAQGHSDVRSRTVAALQQRFEVDAPQARRVRKLALALFEAVAQKDDAQAVQDLAWAADLHEIGMAISHHDFHRHGAYLLSHLDAPGFSQSHQRALATLVLAQRGRLRKVDEALAQDVAAWQILCLRLAVIWCHARELPASPELLLTREGPRAARLAWRPARLEPNPRTVFLLREELAAWARVDGFVLEAAGL